MKLKLIALAGVLALGACSTTKSVNPDEQIRNQTLTTNFTEDTVKVETNCTWYKFWEKDCKIVAIESTATAWTNGTSTVQVNEARKVGDIIRVISGGASTAVNNIQNFSIAMSVAMAM